MDASGNVPERSQDRRIPLEDLKIELISETHKNLLGSFKTDSLELKKFLLEDALSNQEVGISYTYLWSCRKNNELVAYITLLADAIRVHGTYLGKSFLEKGVEYKTLPALKVGRLCVHKDYTGRGIGTLMTKFAMEKIVAMNEQVAVGCRFLIVDAKKDAVHFYKKMDFQVLKAREKGTLPMYRDMLKQIRIKRK